MPPRGVPPFGTRFIAHESQKRLIIDYPVGHALQRQCLDQCATDLNVNLLLHRLETHQNRLIAVVLTDIIGVFPELDRAPTVHMTAEMPFLILSQPRIGVHRFG